MKGLSSRMKRVHMVRIFLTMPRATANATCATAHTIENKIIITWKLMGFGGKERKIEQRKEKRALLC